MRFSISIPDVGDFAGAGTVAKVAAAAGRAGWGALFVADAEDTGASGSCR